MADDAWVAHTKVVLQHTLGRQELFVRGSCMVGDNLDLSLSKTLRAGMENLVGMLNGDIRKPWVQHVECGCCLGGRDQIVQGIVSAIWQSGLLFGGESAQVSKNRWGSCTQFLARQVGGNMFHNILHRTLVATFPREGSDVEDPNQADDDDFRAQMDRKVKHNLSFQR